MTTLKIDLDPQNVSQLLDEYALDWGAVPAFLGNVANSQGVAFDEEEVERLMTEMYYDGEADE